MAVHFTTAADVESTDLLSTKGWLAFCPLDPMLHSKGTLHKPLGSLCADEVDVLKQGPFAPMIQGTEAACFASWSQGER